MNRVKNIAVVILIVVMLIGMVTPVFAVNTLELLAPKKQNVDGNLCTITYYTPDNNYTEVLIVYTKPKLSAEEYHLIFLKPGQSFNYINNSYNYQSTEIFYYLTFNTYEEAVDTLFNLDVATDYTVSPEKSDGNYILKDIFTYPIIYMYQNTKYSAEGAASLESAYYDWYYEENGDYPSFCEHNYTSTSIDANCDTPAQIIYTCTKCNNKIYEFIGEENGHTFVDNVCTVCNLEWTTTGAGISSTQYGKTTIALGDFKFNYNSNKQCYIPNGYTDYFIIKPTSNMTHSYAICYYVTPVTTSSGQIQEYSGNWCFEYMLTLEFETLETLTAFFEDPSLTDNVKLCYKSATYPDGSLKITKGTTANILYNSSEYIISQLFSSASPYTTTLAESSWVTIPANPYTVASDHTHTYEVKRTIQSTCKEEGSILYRCSICDYQYLETTPIGNHSYNDNGVCTVCLTTNGTGGNSTNNNFLSDLFNDLKSFFSDLFDKLIVNNDDLTFFENIEQTIMEKLNDNAMYNSLLYITNTLKSLFTEDYTSAQGFYNLGITSISVRVPHEEYSANFGNDVIGDWEQTYTQKTGNIDWGLENVQVMNLDWYFGRTVGYAGDGTTPYKTKGVKAFTDTIISGFMWLIFGWHVFHNMPDLFAGEANQSTAIAKSYSTYTKKEQTQKNQVAQKEKRGDKK